MRSVPTSTVTYGGSGTPTPYKLSKTHFKAYVAVGYTDTGTNNLTSAEYSAEL